jgi:hypothetical protein
MPAWSVSGEKSAAPARRFAPTVPEMENLAIIIRPRREYLRCRSKTRSNISPKATKSALVLTRKSRLYHAEKLKQSMIKAWRIHLPNVDLNDALRSLEKGICSPATSANSPSALHESDDQAGSTCPIKELPEHLQPSPSPKDCSNAEDYEFDESQDFNNSLDGMGCLTMEPHKAGYMGAHSGIAALKLLQSLPLYLPVDNSSPSYSLDGSVELNSVLTSPVQVSRYLDNYFSMFHSAYPILHEGTFRARVSGMKLLLIKLHNCLITHQVLWQSHETDHGRYYTTLYCALERSSGIQALLNATCPFFKLLANIFQWMF